MESLVQNKSFQFAIEIVRLFQALSGVQREYVLSKQLLRSGTSIGANVEEALQAQSRKDFLSKMNIALKEAVETQYWLRLLAATDYAIPSHMIQNCEELRKMLSSIVKTTKETAP